MTFVRALTYSSRRRAWERVLHPFMAELVRFCMRPRVFENLRFFVLPEVIRRHFKSPQRPWDVRAGRDLPVALKGVVGIGRDPDTEDRFARDLPLQSFEQVHADGILFELMDSWPSLVPSAPLAAKAEYAVAQTRFGARRLQSRHDLPGSDELARSVKSLARELGFADVGITRYDRRYFCEGYHRNVAGDRIVVLVLEQDYETAQSGPGFLFNLATWDATSEAYCRAANLAHSLQERGIRAVAHGSSEALAIPFGVAAGLGQLGLNGQLLTPNAGSRCRLALVSVGADLELDEPQDFGIPQICDACQVCVRRCPAGAIRTKRSLHRGVEKAKVNTGRCFPTVAQADGCAICITVCPIQKYGWRRVVDHFSETGEVLGKGSEELESYNWPPEDRVIPPGQRPKLSRAALNRDFFNPPGFNFDIDRRLPASADNEKEQM